MWSDLTLDPPPSRSNKDSQKVPMTHLLLVREIWSIEDSQTYNCLELLIIEDNNEDN